MLSGALEEASISNVTAIDYTRYLILCQYGFSNKMNVLSLFIPRK